MSSRPAPRYERWYYLPGLDVHVPVAPWLLGILAGLGVLALVAGLFLPISKPSRPGGPATLKSVSGLTIDLPPGWRPADSPPEIPGLRFSERAAFASGAGGGMIAGRVVAGPPTYLPPALVERAGTRVPDARPLFVGASDAYEYPDMRIAGFDRRLTLYVFPAERRPFVLACFAEPGRAARFMPECGAAAASVGVPSLLLTPSNAGDPGYGRSVRAAVRRLRASRALERATLARASGSGAQATAALALADAYRGAEERLLAAQGRLPAGRVGASSPGGLAVALGGASDAYRELATAAQRRDGAGWRVAGARVKGAETSVDRELAALAAVGYGSR